MFNNNENINKLVDMLVDDINEISEDPAVVYEVWAIGHDEEDCETEAEMLLATFEDPDQAVHYAKNITLADVVDLAADDEYTSDVNVHSISIEVETVIPYDDGTMNVGTVYKKTLEIYEELPEFVQLTTDDYVLMDNGDIMVPCSVLSNYNKNDYFTAVFDDSGISQPMIYKIISKTTSDHYICEFV